MRFDISGGILSRVDYNRDETTIIIPNTVTEIAEPFRDCFNYYNYSRYYSKQIMQQLNYYVFFPDSVEKYRFKCLSEIYIHEVNLPYRKTLELAVEDKFCTDILTVRLSKDEYLKFDLTNVNIYNPVKLALKMFRTEDLSLRTPFEIKAPLALHFAKNNNKDALAFIQKNFSKIGRYLIAMNDANNFEIILNFKLASKKGIESLIEFAKQKEQNEIFVMLTQYKFDNFQDRKVTDRFKL